MYEWLVILLHGKSFPFSVLNFANVMLLPRAANRAYCGRVRQIKSFLYGRLGV